jgi:hypothetical protein
VATGQPPLEAALLRDYAARHIAYELRTLAQQAREFGARRAGANLMTLRDAVEDALLEAALIHLRLLNEFLGRRPRLADVAAEHYVPSWQRHEFLTKGDRVSIDRQLVHLSSLRAERMPHHLARLTVDCGHAFHEFEVALNGDPLAVARFGESFQEAFRWAALLREPPPSTLAVFQSTTS